MKKANQIINHLFKPLSPRLNKYRCLKKIISLLPENYNKYISYVNLKGDTLIIGVSHSAMQKIIYYNQDTIFFIKESLKENNECKDVEFTKIRTFFKYKKLNKKEKKIPNYLLKKPKGTFKNQSSKFKDIFEEIREIINDRNN